jgi:hypothetical protein
MSSTILGIIASSGGAAASTSSYESIASLVGDGSATSLTFNSIPSTYTHLQIRAITNDASGEEVGVRLNGDTGTNYSHHYLRSTGAAVSASGSATQARINFMGVTANSTTIMGVTIIDLHDYASTTKYKTVRTFMGYDSNGGGIVYLSSGLWQSTSAVTSLTVLNIGGFAFGTQTVFSLYGIKG